MAEESAIIVGVGPGLGSALAQRFAAGGLNVAMVARHPERLTEDSAAPDDGHGRRVAYTGDATDEAQMAAVFDAVADELGPVRAVMFNAGSFDRALICYW